MGKVTRRSGPVRIALEGLVQDADKYSTRVGWVDSSSYPTDRGGIPVAYAAAIAEYGYAPGGIPARPILGPTVDQNRASWEGAMAILMKRVVAGGLSLEQVYHQLGLVASGDVKKTIQQISAPPLKDSTIAQRARIKNTTPEAVNKEPLRFEGILINTATYEVVSK